MSNTQASTQTSTPTSSTASKTSSQLADDNNLPVDQVAKMAGQKLVARAQPGEYVQGLNGKWLKK